MPPNAPTEAELATLLARHGLVLTPEQRAALMPGVAIMQTAIDRVNADLPREAEPAAFFRAEQG
jgi:hypothetical protein